MVDDGDGELMLALEVAQKGEQGSDLGGRILVDAMQADEGVEDQLSAARVLVVDTG